MSQQGFIKSKLIEFIYRCDKLSVDYTIAIAFIDKLSEFPDIYIEEIAYRAKTTPASVTRFCRKLGYDSFKELKNDSERISHWEVLEEAMDLYNNVSESEAETYFFEQDKLLTRETLKNIDATAIRQIADAIKKTKRVVFVTPSYALAGVNVFREMVEPKKIIVFKVSRHIKKEIVIDLMNRDTTVVVISMTGTWVADNVSVLKKMQDNNVASFLVGTDKLNSYSNYVEGIVTLGQGDMLLNSSYKFLKSHLVFFWLLASML